MDFIKNLFSFLTTSQDYINGLALIGFIGINIFLGSLDAWINKEFQWMKFQKGIVKGIGIIMATFAAYTIGNLIPNVLVMTVNEVDVNITTAIQLTITAGLIWYGKEIVIKLKNAIIGSEAEL
ncbi:phage holin family protein [Sinanaerobacter chloroacetimidivorans]|uniref:Uncharacterized protein n=1 Tax=Sinanaerobacter chloroacetimidivorans TaxID=2818044 RepID=A0A8J8AZW4_9FIRM|nr:phage holin family protein [Sinanaerobacter chloroacetimidivorans]MBR0596963.1 hypothetical protein [Sinanaerobacter chloroacetimidivorans]